MIKSFATVVLVSASASAFAQPAATPPGETPPGETTPAVVEGMPADASSLAPRVYRKGNLRLSIACANTWATPDTGLAVSVDGAAKDAQRLNGRWSFYSTTDKHGNVDSGEVWNPTDVGYLVAPGSHHVQIDMPGCAPTAFDVNAYADRAEHAEGRLAITDWNLMGPVGAPNGFGLMVGGWYGGLSSGPNSNSIFQQTATFAPGGTATGGVLSFSVERYHLAMAVDEVFASGAISGEVSSYQAGNQQAPQAFTGSRNMSATQFRIGARLPLHTVALAAGGGVGVQVWFDSTTITGDQTSLFPPSDFDASFYLPVWASATIKPTCDWGVQVIGQYDVHPGSTSNDGFDVMGGLLYQPSASCSEPAGVRVSTN